MDDQELDTRAVGSVQAAVERILAVSQVALRDSESEGAIQVVPEERTAPRTRTVLRKTMNTKQKITNYFVKNPTAVVKDVAAKYNVSVPYVYNIRKQAMHQAQEQIATETLGPQLEEPKANAVQFGGNHYKTMGVEPWDVVDTWPIEQQIGYHRGNGMKYLMRLGNKDEALQEAQKALHYIQKLVEVLSADSQG